MKPDNSGRPLLIGEVAARAGVNAQTLRYYERRGIIAEPRRTTSGYRAYEPETVAIIRFIKRAQELGFTLEEAEELLKLRRLRGMKRAEARALAADKLRGVDEKLAHLKAIRSAIGALLESCACSDGGVACPILEALEHPAGEAAGSLSDGMGDGQGREKAMKTIALTVEGMSCEGCASRVKGALRALEGVEDVSVDLGQKHVRVQLGAGAVGAERVATTIQELGYTVTASEISASRAAAR